MNGRDQEYIWNRLSAPAGDALDAHERLKRAGEHAAAERLMRALQTFTDECRAIRNDVFPRGGGY